MNTTVRTLMVIALAGGLAAASVSAQSLADVARREQAREKTITVHGRLYTNADLQPSREETSDASAAQPAGASAADVTDSDTKAQTPAASTAAPANPSSDASDASATKAPVHDRAYWQKRMATARATRDQAQVLLDAMQSRINALTADFTARDDPAQRARIGEQRDKAVAELGRLKQALDAATKGIADLEEEARRAGVPPGWLR